MNEKDYDFAGLVKKCKEIREKVQYRDLFENGYDRFYLSAKDIPFPILEERRGIIIVDTLDYKETYYDDWLNHR